MFQPGPYYPLGTTGTVPRAYEGTGGENKSKGIKKIGKLIQNKIQDFKNTMF
jgi:hypothetical protein